MKLYELTTEMLELMDSEDCEETALAKVFGDIEAKAQSICQFTKTLEGDIAAFKAEEERISARRKAMENTLKKVRDYVLENMERLEIDTLKAGTFTVALQNSPPAVEIEDETLIPAKYYDIIPQSLKLDKNKLKEDLKNGEIPGCHLKKSKHIRIR